MQFTTTAEHAELVERARALFSHRAGKVSLGELHLQAMRTADAQSARALYRAALMRVLEVLDETGAVEPDVRSRARAVLSDDA